MSHGAEPPGDGVAAVDAFGGLPGLEDEELEAVVGLAMLILFAHGVFPSPIGDSRS